MKDILISLALLVVGFAAFFGASYYIGVHVIAPVVTKVAPDIGDSILRGTKEFSKAWHEGKSQ